MRNKTKATGDLSVVQIWQLVEEGGLPFQSFLQMCLHELGRAEWHPKQHEPPLGSGTRRIPEPDAGGGGKGQQALGVDPGPVPNGRLGQVQHEASAKREVVLKPPDEVQGSLWAGKDGNVIQVREDALTEVRPDVKLQIPQRCTQA